MKDLNKARLSYSVELVITVSTGLFVVAWVHQLRTSNGIFSPSFMAEGFCNNQIWDTQTKCAYFDFAMAATVMISCIFFQACSLKTACAAAGYLITHGYAHFEVSQGKIDPSEDITGKAGDILILAIVLAMGPISLFHMLKEKLSLAANLTLSIAAEVATVALFTTTIRRGIWALSYINVSIYLWILIPRLLLYGPNNLKRLKTYSKKTPLMLELSTGLINHILVWIEPVQCDQWYAAIGGHFWFDVSLFVLLLLQLDFAFPVKLSTNKVKVH